MTRGLTPYGTMQSWEEIEKYIIDGKRLGKPNHCDDTIYQVMLQCWNGSRSERPTFNRLANFLFDHYTKLMNGGMSGIPDFTTPYRRWLEGLRNPH